MNMIKTHAVTLYGGADKWKIILRPLSDGHLPDLYTWCADPEVFHQIEGRTSERNLLYSKEAIHHIYGAISQRAYCFLIEANGEAVGECSLQRMSMSEDKAIYSEQLDLRRIDICIGEKSFWNQEIVNASIGMLINFAFVCEKTDALHCFCEDSDPRSKSMWEKHGFKQASEDPLPQLQKGKRQCHLSLARQDYFERRRMIISAEKQFTLPIKDLQPSQLWINEEKLHLLRKWFDAENSRNFDPIPIKQFHGKFLMTDGHTRAVAAYLAGWESIPVYWDEDKLNMQAYATCVKWCDDENIRSPVDLIERIVPYVAYEALWLKKCMEL